MSCLAKLLRFEHCSAFAISCDLKGNLLCTQHAESWRQRYYILQRKLENPQQFFKVVRIILVLSLEICHFVLKCF